jgi:hypothetical protein
MKTWFRYSEHFEKYWLLIFATITNVALLHLTYLSFYKDKSTFITALTYLFITNALLIVSVVIRKGMKYKIGKEGIEISDGENVV